MKNIIGYKSFVIGVVVGLSIITTGTYAAVSGAGAIGNLFEKISAGTIENGFPLVADVYRMNGTKIVDNSLTTNELRDNTIESDKIGDGEVKVDDIDNNAVTSAKVAPNTLTADDLANNSVGTGELSDNAVTSAKVAPNTLTADDLANNSVGTGELSDNAVTSVKVAPNTLTVDDLANNSVGSGELSDNSVTSAKVAPNTLTADDLANNSVGTGELSDNAVTSAKVALNSLTEFDLADNSVGTLELKDNTITSEKVASGALAGIDLSDNSIGNRELNNLANLTINNIYRSSHTGGHLVGSYNSVGANSTRTNPIYSIGSNYLPSGSTLANHYGIGYTHGNASFAPTGMGWGMYVSADGDARHFLDSTYGTYWNTGGMRVDSTTVIDTNAWLIGDRIQQNSIDSSEIQNNTIASTDILNETITASDLGPNSVGSSELIASPAFTNPTVGTPTAGTHAANKAYVDNLVNGLTWKAPVTTSASATYGTCNSSKESWTTFNKSDNVIYVCNGASWVQMSSTIGLPNLAGEVNGSITSNTIASNVIDSTNVIANSLTAGDLAPNSVGTSEVANNSLVAGDLAADSVGASELANNSVGSANVIANSLTAGDLAPNSVGTSEVASNSLLAGDLAADSVGASELANNSVGSANVIANSLTAGDLAPNSVGNSELIDSPAFTNPTAATPTISTHIATKGYVDSQVGGGIPNLAGEVKGGITSNIIADNVIDSANIQDNSLTDVDLAPNSVGDSEMIDNPTFVTTTSSSFFYSSDKRLKKDIKKIDSSLEKINKLEGVEFVWKKGGKKDIGLIAQDVEEVFPNLVSTNSYTGFKAVQYGNLVSPIIEAIKELTVKVGELFEKFVSQENRINYLENENKQLEIRLQKLELMMK